MQTKNFTRGTRRHNREVAIQHAFNIKWYKWYDGAGYAFEYHRLHDDLIILEDNESRFAHEDAHRADVLTRAKLQAKHLRSCSCFLCKGDKQYDVKTVHQLREEYRDADELAYLLKDDSWEEKI